MLVYAHKKNSQNIDGFRQNDSHLALRTHTTLPNPLEKILIFTIYQNYSLALKEHVHVLPQGKKK